MKKLTALLLSLVMCLSLLAVPAQAEFDPDSDGPGVTEGSGTEGNGTEGSVDPGTGDPDNPGETVQPNMPGPRETVPIDSKN